MERTLNRIGVGVPYRLVLEACAAMAASGPALEGGFLRVSRSLWQAPVIGRPVRGIGFRLLDRLRSRGDVFRTVEGCGVRLDVDVTHWMFGTHYLAALEYEPVTARYLMQHLSPGNVFIDVGSNAGYFSLLAADRVGPSGRVFAFEPNPPVLALLEQHVDRNKCRDRVRTFDTALSDQASNATLYVWAGHSGFSSLDLDRAPGASHLQGGDTVGVRTCTFDEWLEREGRGIQTIDLMKIDVEGAERQVIAGMKDTLAARRITRIVCETQWDGPAHQLLASHGYVAEPVEAIGPGANIAFIRP